MTTIRVLGPMQLCAGSRVLTFGPPRRRAVFAALVAEAGRPVPVETVVDRVWDTAPAGDVRATLYAHISRIRALLAEVQDAAGIPRLAYRDGAYLLEVGPDHVDLHRFRRLIELARGRPDDEQSALLSEALQLWRGAPFTGLSGQWLGRLRDMCHRQRLDAVLSWARIEQRRGHAELVVDQIHELVWEYPLAEPLIAVLMRALYTTGHAAEALNRYAALRERLGEELGTDPCPELQDLYQAILRNELPGPASRAATPTTTAETPAQLPVDVRGFTGRAGDLARLDAILATAQEQAAAAVVVVSGTAGVGKTTLALHWAHHVSAHFPDGQLYVNLRGFDPSGSALSPAHVIRDFLDAFAVPSERLPTGAEAQVALYRSLLAARRVLLVLDNARETDQVRPLLPGSPGCLVLVTSRDQMTSLVAAEGAHVLTLDLLTPVEAGQLLAGRLGADRVAAEAPAATAIARRCAGLPLALAIVAARAAAHPAFSLAALAGELADPGSLDAFDHGHPATDIRAVFSWSYRTLSGPAARLFRLLSLHSGPDAAVPVAASLLGAPQGQARSLLCELARAHLVTEHVPGRYAFHDLLRAYAGELAHRHDTAAEREAAFHRLVDHYVQTAHRADRLVFPHRDALAPAAPRPGVTIPDFSTAEQAMAWFTGEHHSLLALAGRVDDAGLDAHACQLFEAIRYVLDRRGSWHDLAAIGQVALAAAQRLGDPAIRARVHHGLATAAQKLGDHGAAHANLGCARELYRAVGDEAGLANAHLQSGWICELRGDRDGALDHARRALQLYQAVDHKTGEASALNAIGWCHAQLGDHRQALVYCERALPLLEELGNRPGQAAALDSLGYIHHQLGDLARATSCYRRALDLHESLGDRYQATIVLTHLGEALHAAGDAGGARQNWQRALDILDDLAHFDAGPLRARIASAAESDASGHTGAESTPARRWQGSRKVADQVVPAP